MSDFSDMISKAKKIQEQMKEVQENLKKIEVEGTAGGDLVKVILNHLSVLSLIGVALVREQSSEQR